jgi:hypothetical protein
MERSREAAFRTMLRIAGRTMRPDDGTIVASPILSLQI